MLHHPETRAEKLSLQQMSDAITTVNLVVHQRLKYSCSDEPFQICNFMNQLVLYFCKSVYIRLDTLWIITIYRMKRKRTIMSQSQSLLMIFILIRAIWSNKLNKQNDVTSCRMTSLRNWLLFCIWMGSDMTKKKRIHFQLIKIFWKYDTSSKILSFFIQVFNA